MSKLLPCPFCGGAGERKRALRTGRARGDAEAFSHFIRCASCAAVGPWKKSASNAARWWNMRATNGAKDGG